MNFFLSNFQCPCELAAWSPLPSLQPTASNYRDQLILMPKPQISLLFSNPTDVILCRSPSSHLDFFSCVLFVLPSPLSTKFLYCSFISFRRTNLIVLVSASNLPVASCFLHDSFTLLLHLQNSVGHFCLVLLWHWFSLGGQFLTGWVLSCIAMAHQLA